MKRALLVVFTFWAAPALSDPWQPDPNDPEQVAAHAALESFKAMATDDIGDMLSKANALAVFPKLSRTGILLGWANGRGVLIEAGEFKGYVRQRRFSLGFQFGHQKQEQILLLRNPETVRRFKEGGIQFTPQASAHSKKPGRAAEGAFHPDVAVLSISRKGLMVEASIGGTGFKFIPAASIAESEPAMASDPSPPTAESSRK